MEKYLNFAWFIAIVTSWISFGFASWQWAENMFDSGRLALVVLWFVMSVILFAVGLRFRKSSS